MEGRKNLLRILSIGRSHLPNRPAPQVRVAIPFPAINCRAVEISGAIEHRGAGRIIAIRRVACKGVEDGLAPTVTGIAATWAPADRLGAQAEHSASRISTAIFGRRVEGSVRGLYLAVGAGTVSAAQLGAEAVQHGLNPASTAVRGQLVNGSHPAAASISCAVEVTVRVPCESSERESTVGG